MTADSTLTGMVIPPPVAVGNASNTSSNDERSSENMLSADVAATT